MKAAIYLIPGLGMDKRLFRKIKLPQMEVKYLEWEELVEGDTLKDLAKRYSEQITEKEFYLLGMSLGGMVAVEMAQIKKPQHLFLISTVKNSKELPKYIKWLENVPEKSTSATKALIETSVALKPYYDSADEEGNELFADMARSAELNFINWAVKEIASWSYAGELNVPFTHYHGTADLIFPIKNIDLAFTIKGGTHFMIYNQGEKLSHLMTQKLNEIVELKNS